MMFSHANWFPINVDGTNDGASTIRYRNNRRQNGNHHGANTTILLSSSSQIVRGAIPRYTRRMRSIVHRFSFLHRLAFMAIFISVVLAFALSLAASQARTNAERRNVYDVQEEERLDNRYAAATRARVPNRITSSQSYHSATPSHAPLSSRISKPVASFAAPSNTPSGRKPKPTMTITASQSAAYHFEDDLVKVEATMEALPHTTWYYQKDIYGFRPPRQHASNIRLISLNNACYCTQRNKFILPRAYRNGHRKGGARFPPFVFRYGAAHTVPWLSPKHVLAFPAQKMVHVAGTTILWRGRTLNTAHNHLHRSLVPIRSLIDILNKSSYHPDIKLVAESFTSPDGNVDVLKLHNYYFGDIPGKNLLELSRLRPRMVCFERVIALGSEYENHASSPDTYDHVKDLILKEEKHVLTKPLIKSCAAPGANMHTVWIMSQQLTPASFGTIENIAEVETVVNNELINLGLAEKVKLRVIQSPNLKCPPGTTREGCYDLNCSDARSSREKDGCARSRSPLHEVQAFNNMTFLITASGPSNEAFSYMPRGAQIIELVPYGILDHSYQQAATDARLMYYRVENKERKDVEQELYNRFGDIALSPTACWQDLECRAVRMGRKTHVNVIHLRAMLKRAMFVWRTICAKELL